MSHAIRFGTDGFVECLHTEAIDLRALGRLSVVRATRIDFDEFRQSWQVRCAASGVLLFTDCSRDACLQWERDQLVPGPQGLLVTGSHQPSKP